MLRVFTPLTAQPTEALQSKRGGTSIIFIDGQEIQTLGKQYEVQIILIYCCSTLSEEILRISNFSF